ncbi:MAG: helix-turn-helix domain-containing protein [Clostridia bacterium]|nr:helix-turn-helix domain-containing protein [Clostridia bacterium]
MKEAFHYLNLNTKNSGEIDKDSRISLKRELVVNCAGSINTKRVHKTNNALGRKDYYLIYITEGVLCFDSLGISTKLKPFDVIVLPPNTPYVQALTESNELNYLWVHFTGNNVESILSQFEIRKFPFINKVSQSNHLQTRFQRLFDCFIKNDEFMERDLCASLEKLLIELARAIRENDKPRVSLSKSLSYINNNFNTQIKIPDLAKMESLSMTQYNLHFKNQIGMPPTKYIITLRMDLARELIESSNLSLVQIASMCGYEDYNFFAKVFKKHTGVSPKRFKK